MNSRFPFPAYPQGWFRVVDSQDLPIGGVKPLHYFGKDLVLFRTQAGTAQVFEAHCPHLGAHLGYGGRVEGNTLVCPFHGWRFDETGHCRSIPDCDTVSPNAQLRTYPIHETQEVIMVYYHAQNASPDWSMPPLPHWHAQEWTPFQRRSWQIRTHPQEMAENVVDKAHMLWLHGQSFKAIVHSQVTTHGAVLNHHLQPHYRLAIAGNWGIDATGVADISCYGLGCQVSYTRVKALIEFQTLALFFLTPINPDLVDVHVLVSTKRVFHPALSYILRRKSMAEISHNLEQDIPIWENKVYRSRPLLSENDGPIPLYRRWAQQFYRDSTPGPTVDPACHLPLLNWSEVAP
jgi:phenylpropionate dioxygenase-like ring-hydroxylating dioxygenase large terminal subunit